MGKIGFNKNNYKPYYKQIKEFINNKIESGKYKPGQKIPSENEFAEKFNVNRLTARNAINELKHEGVLFTKKGIGTFVKKKKIEQSLLKFYSFGLEYKDILHSEVMDLCLIEPNKKLTKKLKLKSSDSNNKIFKLERLRYISDQPAILETIYVLESVCSNFNKHDFSGKTSVYNVLETNGVVINNAVETIEMCFSNEKQSDLLQVKLNYPLFFTERITKDINNNLFELRESFIRPENIRFHVEIS